MADKKSNNADNKKVKIKQFKINFMFNDKGESFEKLTERAFGNWVMSDEMWVMRGEK